MARINQQRSARQNMEVNNGVRGARVRKQRTRHKVVLESADQKDDKDKLRVVLSFHMEPPPGYTFIPAGNTQLTAAMKDFAKRAGQQVMAVSATPHAKRHELSREVHRIGYHFPTEVVSQVCSHYGIRLDSSGRLVGENDTEQLFMKITQKGEVVLNESVRDQVTINTEAKEIIRDLFPKIPDNDLFQIIKTAFQLGTNKVGTAEEIPLVRRAQLAVVAHIRHTYTNYDKLLRQLAYNDARHAVEEKTLQKLVEWRENDKIGEDTAKHNVDDAMREVVVLSDEDESDSELEEGQVPEHEHAKARPVHEAERPEVVTENRPISPAELSSGEEAPLGYRYVPQAVRRVQLVQPHTDYNARLQSRYARWEQVRQSYLPGPSSAQATHVVSHVPVEESTMIRTVAPPDEMVYVSAPVPQHQSAYPQSMRVVREPSPQRLLRGAGGRLYEKVAVTNTVEVLPRDVYSYAATAATTVSRPAAANYPPPRKSASPRSRPVQHRRTPSMNDNGTILPSIERAENGYTSPRDKQIPVERYAPLGVRTHPYADGSVSSRSELVELTNNTTQVMGRSRLDLQPRDSLHIMRDAHPRRQDVIMTDAVDLNRRPLIEIQDTSHIVPSPHVDRRREPVYLPRDRVMLDMQSNPEQRRAQYYEEAPPRRVVYEMAPPQQEVRYIYTQPSMVTPQPVYYDERRPVQYVQSSFVDRRPMHEQSSPVEVLSRNENHVRPVEVIRRVDNVRYQPYPTMHERH